jgi:hypothetical protein
MLISCSLIPIVAGRLYFLWHSRTCPNLYLADIFAQGAMHYALMAECALCLKPFLQAFHQEYRPSLANSQACASNPSRAPYSQFSDGLQSKSSAKPRSQELSAIDATSSRGTQRAQSRQEQDQELSRLKLRSDSTGFRASIAVDVRKSPSESRSSRQFEGHQEAFRLYHGIQQTTTFTLLDEVAGMG